MGRRPRRARDGLRPLRPCAAPGAGPEPCYADRHRPGRHHGAPRDDLSVRRPRPRHERDGPARKATTYTYDPLGRVLTVTLPPSGGSDLNFTTTYSYDNFDVGTGLVFTQITDPNGRLTRLGYDRYGRLARSIDASGNATAYTYTKDVLTSITDANGNVTTYQYDNQRRLTRRPSRTEPTRPTPTGRTGS